MSQKKNDIIYTASDIEKYHKGLLSAKEMHDLEKAALDDPFLADALEGYAVRGENINADIAELKNRLAKRTEEEKNKTVPVVSATKSSFYWLKVAAMVVLIAGAGLIVYQLGFNKKTTELAQAASKEAETLLAKDSGNTTPSGLLNTDSNTISAATEKQEKDKAIIKNNKNNPVVTKDENTRHDDNPKAIIIDTEAPAYAPTIAGAPAAAEIEKVQKETSDNAATRQRKASIEKQEENKAKRLNNYSGQDRDSQTGREITGKAAGIAANVNSQSKPVSQTNIFRGRVTDSYNNALPFSNITNTEDGIGTYSDARGYFTLTSPDSILTVQVRSLGFENENVQLQNNVPNNQVQLQEDRSSLAEVVISNNKSNSNRIRTNTMVLEEPEPADGWNNYDIYLANNLKTPEIFKDKQSGIKGEVELIFEVDKNGEPVNITVKKSLCEICDKEAIRLVKEGPKWKRKTRKGKATVKIAF